MQLVETQEIILCFNRKQNGIKLLQCMYTIKFEYCVRQWLVSIVIDYTTTVLLQSMTIRITLHWTSMFNFKDFQIQLTLKEQSGKIKYLGVLAHLPAWIDSFTLKGKCHEKIMLFKDVAPCLKNELQTDPPFSDPVFESWSCSTYLSQDTVPLNANW